MGDPWRLIGFESRLDVWIELESPDVDLRGVVVNWILSRIEDPYPGMGREPEFDNLWFAPIPASERPDGTVVVCSLWVEETSRSVRCDQIASLNLPA